MEILLSISPVWRALGEYTYLWSFWLPMRIWPSECSYDNLIIFSNESSYCEFFSKLTRFSVSISFFKSSSALLSKFSFVFFANLPIKFLFFYRNFWTGWIVELSVFSKLKLSGSILRNSDFYLRLSWFFLLLLRMDFMLELRPTILLNRFEWLKLVSKRLLILIPRCDVTIGFWALGNSDRIFLLLPFACFNCVATVSILSVLTLLDRPPFCCTDFASASLLFLLYLPSIWLFDFPCSVDLDIWLLFFDMLSSPGCAEGIV